MARNLSKEQAASIIREGFTQVETDGYMFVASRSSQASFDDKGVVLTIVPTPAGRYVISVLINGKAVFPPSVEDFAAWTHLVNYALVWSDIFDDVAGNAPKARMRERLHNRR